MFGHDWQRVDGVVRSAQSKPGWAEKHSQVGGMGAPLQYVVEIPADHGGVTEVEIEIQPTAIWVPAAARGKTVPLLIDRKSGKAKFDVNDPRLDVKTNARAEDAEADAMQAEAEEMLNKRTES